MFKTEIKTLKKDLKEIETTIKSTDNKAVLKALETEKNKLLKRIEKLEVQDKSYDKIKDLSPSDALKLIDSGDLSIDKETLNDLLKTETHMKFKDDLNKAGWDVSELMINDRGMKLGGYILTDGDNTYLLSYNHLTAVATIKNGILSVKLNDQHDKFKSNNCLKCMKQFIVYLYSKYNIDLNNDFKVEVKDWGVNLTDDGEYIRLFLSNLRIDIDVGTVLKPYAVIDLKDDVLMADVKNLIY